MGPEIAPAATISGTPEFLVVGHITKDVQADGYTIGGTVTYSSLTARNLGRRAAILTAAGPDLDAQELLRGVMTVRLPSPATTTFQNLYPDGHRVQYLRAVAAPIPASAVPPAWRHTPVVHLGPLTQELTPDLARIFEGSLIGVTPQGWMRQWDGTGRVSFKHWESAAEVLSVADVLVYSEEDVAHAPELIDVYAELARIMVVTRSAQGADLYYRGRVKHFPAFVPAAEVDPTGAGDVFAAAFLLKLHDTGDAELATHFANCVASFCVEKPGVLGIPTREQVEERLVHGRLRV